MLPLLFALALAQDDATPASEPDPSALPADAEEPPSEPVDSELEESEEPDAEPAPEAPVEYSIAVDGDELGSALDDFEEKSQRYRKGDPDALDLDEAAWRGLRPQLFRGRWFVKPVIAWATLQGKSAVPLGLAGGHQWFPASNHPLQVSGETRLDLTAPVGAAKGRSVQLVSTLGPWVGPVGIRVGPVFRYDRWESEAALLDDAVALGLRATAGVDAEYVKPWVGVEPVWLVAGQREAWGAIGELSLLGGVQFATRMAHLGIAGTLRQTSAGPFLQLAFTAHLRPR